MLDLNDVGLIESDGEQPPRECRLSVVVDGSHVVVPIAQPPFVFVLLLTLGLFAFATPLCVVVYESTQNQRELNNLPVVVMVIIAWIISVFGPAAYCLFWPIGVLRPDHWLRFDRELRLLSIRGGWSVLRCDEILCLLSVTDLRKKQTELQVIARTSVANKKHFVANCRMLDPEKAFGNTLQRFGKLSKILVCFATISHDGMITVTRGIQGDEQGDPPKSPVSREFES